MKREGKERRMQGGAGGAKQEEEKGGWMWEMSLWKSVAMSFAHVGVSSLHKKLLKSSLKSANITDRLCSPQRLVLEF